MTRFHVSVKREHIDPWLSDEPGEHWPCPVQRAMESMGLENVVVGVLTAYFEKEGVSHYATLPLDARKHVGLLDNRMDTGPFEFDLDAEIEA